MPYVGITETAFAADDVVMINPSMQVKTTLGSIMDIDMGTTAKFYPRHINYSLVLILISPS